MKNNLKQLAAAIMLNRLNSLSKVPESKRGTFQLVCATCGAKVSTGTMQQHYRDAKHFAEE
jgi:hypothetical protein